MGTKTRRPELLPDDVWAQMPRFSADRRVVGVVFLAVLLMIPAVIAANSAGILTPRLTLERGRSSADARTRTVSFDAVVTNKSDRSWRITGATVNLAGVDRRIRMRAVTLAAHHLATVAGVIDVDDCAALPAGAAEIGRNTGDLVLRVQRLFGTSSVTFDAFFDRQVVVFACAT